MEIAIQVVVVILEMLASMQKKKSSILIFYTIDNATLAFMFFLFNRYTTALICILSLVRTIIFMIFNIKGKKPNLFVLIAFEFAYLLTTIISWQDALDILPMLGSMAACYGSWQDETSVLRICYIINPTLYTIYKIIIKTYISIIPEVLLLISNLVTLIYYNILKKEKPILEYLNFKRKKNKDVENQDSSAELSNNEN